MAFQSGMGERDRQPQSRDAGHPLSGDLRSSLLGGTSGILCREQGQEIGTPICGRTASAKAVVVPWSWLDIVSGLAACDEHEARPEEFAGLRELGRDALGVENGRLLVGMLVSGSVQRQAVFVDDMKEVSHAAELGRSIAGFQ